MKPIDIQKIAARIELVVFDVDGVFTDGRIWISDDGVETKSFHTQDGFGVRQLMRAGVEIAVLSGRRSNAVEKRMSELGVRHVMLGNDDKMNAFRQLVDKLGIAVENTAYAGDDVPDVAVLEVAGLGIAVENAVAEVKSVSAVTTTARGGHGAVREICDMLLAARNRD